MIVVYAPESLHIVNSVSPMRNRVREVFPRPRLLIAKEVPLSSENDTFFAPHFYTWIGIPKTEVRLKIFVGHGWMWKALYNELWLNDRPWRVTYSFAVTACLNI